jgi:type IV pilus assembly protein PilW
MTTGARASRAGGAAGRGVTLVELLVAMVIGLLLTVVVAQLFLGSRQSFATTDDLSRMQENIRYSQQVLNRTVHLSGYKSKPNSVTSAIFDGAGNPAIIGSNGSGVEPGTDEITVRYQGSGDGAGAADWSIQDCLGNPVDAGVMSRNTFGIGPGANGAPALRCSTDGGATWVELAPNVENMQIVYGEDTDTDLVANRLVPANQVTNWGNVVGVRIALLYQTPGALSKGAVGPSTYDLNGAVNGVVLNFNDQRIRRAVTTTINLRNRTP